MDKRNRVFMVSGTLQAIMALSLIEDAGNKDEYNNYVFINGLAVNMEASGRIIATIREILKAGSFECVDDMMGINEELSRLHEMDRFSECEKLISDWIGLDNVDELFLTDNAKQLIMIMTGRTFDTSHIVHYGDGMGYIRSGLGAGFSHIDEIRTFVPVEFYKGFSEKLPLRIIDKSVFYSVCDKVYSNNESFKSAIDKRRGTFPKNSALLMMQQFTEWRMMDFDKELSMYVKAVLRNCQKGDTIVVKEHPRDITEKRGEFLTELLTEAGFNVIRLTDEALRLVPIELICRFLDFKRVICTSSTAGIHLKYLYGMEADISVDDEDYANYKRGPYLRLYIDGLRQALKNVDTWDMKGPLYSYERPPGNYQISGKKISYITYEEAYLKILTGYYMKDRRLSDFFTDKGMNNVAVYGLSTAGRLIAEDLLKCGELNVYLLDRSFCGQTFLDKPVYYFDTLKESVDCVFVATTHSLEEIRELAKERLGSENVFSLKDL